MFGANRVIMPGTDGRGRSLPSSMLFWPGSIGIGPYW
jgi:hypothetical protein